MGLNETVNDRLPTLSVLCSLATASEAVGDWEIVHPGVKIDAACGNKE